MVPRKRLALRLLCCAMPSASPLSSVRYASEAELATSGKLLYNPPWAASAQSSKGVASARLAPLHAAHLRPEGCASTQAQVM